MLLGSPCRLTQNGGIRTPPLAAWVPTGLLVQPEQVAQAADYVLLEARIVPDLLAMAQGRVEDAALAVLVRPGDRIVIVGPPDARFAIVGLSPQFLGLVDLAVELQLFGFLHERDFVGPDALEFFLALGRRPFRFQRHQHLELFPAI